MPISELCYTLKTLPDLSLDKYSSLQSTGVDGVLDRHISFLRQWNRKGILAGTSIHLFYYYDGQSEQDQYFGGETGDKLQVLFMIRGEEQRLENVDAMVRASSLSSFFNLTPCRFDGFIDAFQLDGKSFPICCALSKKEVSIRSSLDAIGENSFYYVVPKWEINEEGRLFNMAKLMETFDQRALYRVDLYPAELSGSIRNSLRTPISVLRQRQHAGGSSVSQRDYEADNVLHSYQELLSSVEESPHFIANIFVFSGSADNAAAILDAAGAEAVLKGTYNIGTFRGPFSPLSFFDGKKEEYVDFKNKLILQTGNKGMIVCGDEYKNYKLCFLPTLFTIEEIAPFFRFPVLYEGEVIQKRKETAPKVYTNAEKGLYLGKDDNGYDVFFPLSNLSKHAFIAGVPGSGKTNTMYHITSSLWKRQADRRIPFLVLEPAKQEYRALANQPGMEEVYIFSPNANMKFPLHINPFEFPKGLMLSEHIRRLESVFEGAFPMEPPAPYILDSAIEAVYRDKGWYPESVNNGKLPFPTMGDLYYKFEEEINKTDYDKEMKGSLKSVLQVRIGSLVRREMGDVFDVPFSTFSPEEWLNKPAVIELEAMGSGPANFLTLMLCTLIRESLKVSPTFASDHARHVIFLEEAHNLIGPDSEEATGSEANPKQAATNFVVKMLAEVRALKEGIIIADQLPTVMAQEVIKNTGLKIGLRITSSDDRALLCSTMSANPIQMEEMATYNTGRALISYEGLMRPFTMQMHEWRGPWSLDNCSRASSDLNWCKTCCQHYKKGDCEPERKIRKQAVTPLNDADLVKLVRERKSYIEICHRSFFIEGTKFSRAYQEIASRVDAVISTYRELNKNLLGIAKEKKDLEDLARSFVIEDPNWETDENKQQVLLDQAQEIFEHEQEVINKYKALPDYQDAYSVIVKAILFAAQIERRKSHWNDIGISEINALRFKTYIEESYTDVQKRVIGINLLQYRAILDAQRVFMAAKVHLPKAEQVQAELVNAAKRFHVEIIMK